MTKLTINIGTADKGDGDSLRVAFNKVNENFTEIYGLLGLDDNSLNLGAFEFTDSVMSTTDSTAIVIDQATTVTSNLTVGGDVLPSVANGGNLGSAAKPWHSLYVSNSTIYLGSTAVGIDANGNLTVNGSRANALGSTLVNGSKTVSLGTEGKLTLPAGTTFEYLNTPLTGHGDGLARLDFALVTDGVITEWMAASADPAGSGYSPGDTFTFDAAFLGIPGASVTIEVLTVGLGGTVENLGFSQPPLYPADIYRNSPINLQVGAESNRWTFGATGRLTTPGDIQLGADGYLRFSDSSFQGTAFVGDATRLYGNVDEDVEVTVRHRPAVSAECAPRGAGDNFVADTSDNDDITVVQEGWTVDIGGTVYTVTAIIDGIDEFDIFATGATFVVGTTYTFTNPTATLKTWTFNNETATLIAPGGAILSSETAPILGGDTYRDFSIDLPTPDGTNEYRWTFGNTAGALTFPDGTTTTGKSITLPLNQSLTVSVSHDEPPPGHTNTFKINPESIKLPTGNGTIFSGTETAANRWNLDAANKTLFFPDAGDGVFPQIKYSTTGNDGMQLYTSAKPIKITVESNTHWTFGTDGTTTFPNNSIKNSLDNSTTITTQETLTANNSYTNVTDFSTDVDLGGEMGVIAGWYQRTVEQIEFALFGPSAFISYLTGLALGRTVIVTYNTASGTATLTGTLTQTFSSTGQSDPNNPSWGRVSGRIDATLPVGQLGIVSINFPVYSTDTNNWTFGDDGTTTFPNNTLKTVNGSNAMIPSTVGTAGAPLTISAGTGGMAADSLNAGNGGDLTISAGNAGSDIGNPSWGAVGGTLVLKAGNSTQPYTGGNVEIRSGTSSSNPGTISLHTGTNQLTFDAAGRLVKLEGITLTAGGQFNICTIVDAGGGYSGDTPLPATTTGGSGTGMTVAFGYGLSGQLVNVSVVNPGLGYTNGNIISVDGGTGSFILTQYNELGNQGNNNFVQSDWTFSTDGRLTLPGGEAWVEVSGSGGVSILEGEYAFDDIPVAAIKIGGTEGDAFTISSYDDLIKTWRFNHNGAITLPAGGVIAEGGGLTGAIKLTPAGGANANQVLLIYPTGTADGDHIHLTAGGGTTELYLGNDIHYVKLVDGGDVQIQASTANVSATSAWNFSTDGTLTFPDGSNVSELIPGTGAAASVVVIQVASSIANEDFVSLPPAPISNYSVPGTDIIVNVTWVTNGPTFYAPRFEVVDGGTGHTGGGEFSGGEVLSIPYTDMGITIVGDWTWYVNDLASNFVLEAGLNEWTFGGNGALIFPDATVQTTALVQGEQIFTVDTGNTDYAPTAVNFNLLFFTPAIGYSSADPISVTLPNGVPGQRLVIFNGLSLVTLTVNPGFFGRDISGGVVAEFIYSSLDGWMPLYGTNSPT